MRTLLYWVLAFFALSLSFNGITVAATHYPSSVPTAYSCPSTDTGGHSNCPTRTQTIGNKFVCYYKTTTTSACSSATYSCTYYSMTGQLYTNADRGLCPSTAAKGDQEGMAQKLVLITGANGFLGSATTLEFLKQGWRVRGTVRSRDKADAWEAKYPEHKKNLEWVIVKDLADDGAFDEAIKGVDAVAHTASPFNFAFKDNVKDMLKPALKGTTSILKAAMEEPSVKAVTITSSLAAAQDLSKGADVGHIRTAKDWAPFTWEEAATTTNPVIVYLASKTFAEKAAWEFVEKEKPSFAMSTVVPPIILGPALQPIKSLADLNLSAGAVWGIVDSPTVPPTAVPVFINVLNVAQAHYQAVVRLSTQRYLLIGGDNDNTVIAKILKEEFPEQAHRIPDVGEGPGPHWGFDSGPAEKELGIEYIGLRETIRAAVMLATWLSKLKIKTRIIDKRSTKVFTGQADGVQSFGFAERLVAEGAHINEVVFWNPDPAAGKDGIIRTKRTPDNVPGTSRFPHAVLTQGRIERFMIDAMHDGLTVDRAILPMTLAVSPDLAISHPITVTLRHLSEEEATPTQVGAVPNGLFRSNLLADDEADARPASGTIGEEETVKAKYVVGCDGARSWVRKQLGITLEGDSADVHWGVLDVLVKTNFPDIRLKCTVQSKSAGSILIVPRERGLVRFYVQLGSTEHGQRVDRSSITPESIIVKAQAIMAPYDLECPFVDWWTVYEVGQRLASTVTDQRERVFIAGDAFHTHSPKSGQGMNTSMMDAYNLGWKLAGVLKGQLSPIVLSTYQSERHKVAQELIDADYKLSRLFSGKGEKDEGNKEFKEFFIKLGKWASGTAVHYLPSVLCVENAEAAKLAVGLPIGMVVSVGDARPWHIGDRLVADGRFRILIFAGDVRDASQMTLLGEVATYLDSARGPLRSFTPAGADIDSVIEVLTVISNPRTSVEPNAFPDILWPAKGRYGIRDYEKIYADDVTYFSGHGQIYENLGINAKVGCLVVVRPDQHVSLVCRLDEVKTLGTFFDTIMLKPAGGTVEC
ncbi:hypothetical protein RQP46_010933 [Phenoliferia psychrophenolica]